MAAIMVQWQNEDVTKFFSPDIDEIVCDYYDHVGVLWTLDIHLDSGIRGKFLSLP